MMLGFKIIPIVESVKLSSTLMSVHFSDNELKPHVRFIADWLMGIHEN
jgi:hypothetical protein